MTPSDPIDDQKRALAASITNTTPPPFSTDISYYSSIHSIPLDILTNQVKRESSFDPFAIGDDGLALGLMQVHRVACETVGKNWDLLHSQITARNAKSAAMLSLDAGAAYLRWCYDNVARDWLWALAAYNQGPTVISRGLAYARAIMPPSSATP